MSQIDQFSLGDIRSQGSNEQSLIIEESHDSRESYR